jgi:hypothetical protein
LRHIVALFLERGCDSEHAMARLDAAYNVAMRLRNSVLAELLLLGFVYGAGRYGATTRRSMRLPGTSRSSEGRHSPGQGRGSVMSAADRFQFMIFRWYFRLAIWIALSVGTSSRIRLDLMPMPPDRVGGLGSSVEHRLRIHDASRRRTWHGDGGQIANRIFFGGAKARRLSNTRSPWSSGSCS